MRLLKPDPLSGIPRKFDKSTVLQQRLCIYKDNVFIWKDIGIHYERCLSVAASSLESKVVKSHLIS